MIVVCIFLLASVIMAHLRKKYSSLRLLTELYFVYL